MRPLTFARRLLITAAGAAVGVLGTPFAITGDPSDVSAEGVAIFVAVAFAGALAGAAVTRRLVTAMIAAVLVAVGTVLGTGLVIFVAACSSGLCD
jgi:hypothetical protein